MTTACSPARFDQTDLPMTIGGLSEEALDQLDFGVIGIDSECVVRLYNTTEGKIAGLSRDRVVGNHLFNVVAPCMNNFMVAQRLQEALETGAVLDETIDYVFTLRMRPVKVKLRLLVAPALTYRYVLVRRAA
jgi:photoactive yellow protein